MSYRLNPPKPKPPKRTMQKTTTLLNVYANNGETCDFAIPCWYKEVVKPREAEHHCKDWHDFTGHPGPRFPDQSCQRWDFAHNCCSWDGDNRCRGHHCSHYVDLSKVSPIHLKDEGYTKITVVFDHPITGVTAVGSIDTNEDWVIRVDFEVNAPDAIDEDKALLFSVYAERGTKRDIVTRGTLHIAHGAYYQS